MAGPPKPIDYGQAYNRLVTPGGELTPAGYAAMRLFNTYVNSGLPPMAAAQLIGGQLIEDSNLAPLQLQGPAIPFQDAPVAQLITRVNQARQSGKGVGLSQWTYRPRQKDLSDYLQSLHPNASALDASAQFTLRELRGQGLFDKLNREDAVLASEADAARNAQNIVLTEYERPQHQDDANFNNRLNLGNAVYDLAHRSGGSDLVTATDWPPIAPMRYLTQTRAAGQMRLGSGLNELPSGRVADDFRAFQGPFPDGGGPPPAPKSIWDYDFEALNSDHASLGQGADHVDGSMAPTKFSFGAGNGDDAKYKSQVDGKNTQVTTSGAPAAGVTSPGSQNSSNISNWIASLAGVNPTNPTQPASPPQNDGLSDRYRNDPAWFLQLRR